MYLQVKIRSLYRDPSTKENFDAKLVYFPLYSYDGEAQEYERYERNHNAATLITLSDRDPSGRGRGKGQDL